MRAFQFPLRRALEWRRTQLEIEENQLRRLAANREELAVAAVKLELVKTRAEQSVREAGALEAADLWALAAYRQRLISELCGLEGKKREVDARMDAQRLRVVEAQRRCRLLEKLEDRRRMEWRIAAERDTESVAAESFLAVWSRRQD
jgi:flagellar biosynthesis chaperone FliJ